MIITKTICDICGNEISESETEEFRLQIRDNEYEVKDICDGCHYKIMRGVNNAILNSSEREKTLSDYILPKEDQNNSEGDSEAIEEGIKDKFNYASDRVRDFISGLNQLYDDTGLSLRSYRVSGVISDEMIIKDSGSDKKVIVRFNFNTERYELLDIIESIEKKKPRRK